MPEAAAVIAVAGGRNGTFDAANTATGGDDGDAAGAAAAAASGGDDSSTDAAAAAAGSGSGGATGAAAAAVGENANKSDGDPTEPWRSTRTACAGLAAAPASSSSPRPFQKGVQLILFLLRVQFLKCYFLPHDVGPWEYGNLCCLHGVYDVIGEIDQVGLVDREPMQGNGFIVVIEVARERVVVDGEYSRPS